MLMGSCLKGARGNPTVCSGMIQMLRTVLLLSSLSLSCYQSPCWALPSPKLTEYEIPEYVKSKSKVALTDSRPWQVEQISGLACVGVLFPWDSHITECLPWNETRKTCPWMTSCSFFFHTLDMFTQENLTYRSSRWQSLHLPRCLLYAHMGHF